MPVRDTSSLINDGPRKGDIYTEGVIDEVKRNNPNLFLLMLQYVATGAAEIYSLPGTITTALIKMSLRSIACKSGLNPSDTDLQVAAAGVIRKENVESYDRDINFTLFKYYLGLGFRGGLATAIYYATNLLTDGRLWAQVVYILNSIGIYIR